MRKEEEEEGRRGRRHNRRSKAKAKRRSCMRPSCLAVSPIVHTSFPPSTIECAVRDCAQQSYKEVLRIDRDEGLPATAWVDISSWALLAVRAGSMLTYSITLKNTDKKKSLKGLSYRLDIPPGVKVLRESTRPTLRNYDGTRKAALRDDPEYAPDTTFLEWGEFSVGPHKSRRFKAKLQVSSTFNTTNDLELTSKATQNVFGKCAATSCTDPSAIDAVSTTGCLVPVDHVPIRHVSLSPSLTGDHDRFRPAGQVRVGKPARKASTNVCTTMHFEGQIIGKEGSEKKNMGSELLKEESKHASPTTLYDNHNGKGRKGERKKDRESELSKDELNHTYLCQTIKGQSQ